MQCHGRRVTDPADRKQLDRVLVGDGAIRVRPRGRLSYLDAQRCGGRGVPAAPWGLGGLGRRGSRTPVGGGSSGDAMTIVVSYAARSTTSLNGRAHCGRRRVKRVTCTASGQTALGPLWRFVCTSIGLDRSGRRRSGRVARPGRRPTRRHVMHSRVDGAAQFDLTDHAISVTASVSWNRRGFASDRRGRALGATLKSGAPTKCCHGHRIALIDNPPSMQDRPACNDPSADSGTDRSNHGRPKRQVDAGATLWYLPGWGTQPRHRPHWDRTAAALHRPSLGGSKSCPALVVGESRPQPRRRSVAGPAHLTAFTPKGRGKSTWHGSVPCRTGRQPLRCPRMHRRLARIAPTVPDMPRWSGSALPSVGG